MDRDKRWMWLRRIVFWLAVLAMIIVGAIVWRFIDIVRSEYLTVVVDPQTEVEILEVRGSRIVLADDEAATRQGVWGISNADAYGQLTSIVSRSEGRVERGLAMFSGTFVAGDMALIDPNAFPSDPRLAHGMPFEEIRVPGDLGVNPAWLVNGARNTWIVFVHGRGGAGREQSLRSIPTYRALGMPILAITYRNDEAGGIKSQDPVTWGLDEWRDVEVALESARLRGATDFVLVGHDMGAAIVLSFLHESSSIQQIRGAILDSPVLDPEALIDSMAADRGFPQIISEVGKAIVRIRFGLEWSSLDQVGRSAGFDPAIPILLLQGGSDEIATSEIADQFVEALPHIKYILFDGASHGALWNSDPARYDNVVTRFLSDAVLRLPLDS